MNVFIVKKKHFIFLKNGKNSKKVIVIVFSFVCNQKTVTTNQFEKIFFLDETFSFFFHSKYENNVTTINFIAFYNVYFHFLCWKSSLWDFLKEPTKNLQKTYSNFFFFFQNFKKSEIFILNFFFGFFVKIKIILVWKCSAWAVLSIYWFTFFRFIHIWNEKLEITRPILFMFFL